MNNNTAAFIMPVYTENFMEFEPTFKKSIDSVLNQTDQNFILVIIDDKSKDKSLIQYLESLKRVDSRIHVIYSKKNKGPGFARNLGIKYAHSINIPFILFNDADDISDINRLKETRIKFEDEEVNVVYSSFKVIDENDQIVNYSEICDSIKEILDGHTHDVVEGENAWLQIALEKNYTNLTSTTAVRTFLANLEQFPPRHVSEDAHTWLRYGAHKGKFSFLNNIYTLYRIRRNIESSSRARVKNFYKLKAKTDVEGYKKAEKIFKQKVQGYDKRHLKECRAKFYFKESISISLGCEFKTAAKLLKQALRLNEKIVFEEICK